jgi:hypothetical protein
VAPLDGRAQRLLTGIDAAPALQEVEPARQPLEQLLGRQDADPRGRKLQRERKVVQLGAELGHRRAGHEARLGRSHARQEELGAVVRLEWGNGVCLLAGNAQELAARDQDVEVRARGEQAGKAVGRLDYVLEVVEKQKQRAVADALGQPVRSPERP